MKLWLFKRKNTDGTPLTPRQKQERQLLSSLPDGMESRLKSMSDDDFKAYRQMFKKRGKSMGDAYLFWIFVAAHYPYIYGWKGVLIWILFIGLSIMTFGFVGLIWWAVDFFRIPGMVKDNNREIAIKTLQDIQLLNPIGRI
jgi:hypothetical protein